MLTYRLPLGQPPQIAMTAVATHGAQRVETYRLPGLWCVHLYDYEAELVLDDTPLAIRPGYASLIAPGVGMEYRFRGMSRHIYAHFRVAPRAGPCRPVPAVQDVRGDFPALSAAFADVPRWAVTQPHRARARLWDILWQLSEPRATVESRSPIERVCELVETHLAEPLYVGELARQVGLSQNHLTRLFRAAQGETVMQYIRRRRVERARQLLTSSTLSVKTIAVEVGIPDLHLFNKVIRDAFGQSPRALRRSA